MALSQKLSAMLDQFATGELVDFARQQIPAEELATRIRAAASGASPVGVLSMHNARIVGDLNLNGVGHSGAPLTLEMIGCEVTGGFRSRRSAWDMLAIANCQLAFIDVPKARFGDLLIEACRLKGMIEAREIDVSGALVLSGSFFKAGPKGIAVELKEARIGRSFRAARATIEGRLSCPGVIVGGEVRLSGSVIGRAGGDRADAVDLEGSAVGGPLDLCTAENAPFRAFGAVKIAAAKVGALAALGAEFDGLGGPAIIADGVVVLGSVMLGRGATHALQVKGSLRFLLSRVGGQFQMADADLESDETRGLILDSARVENDVFVGRPGGGVRLKQAISANSLTSGGRFMLSEVTANGIGSDDGCAVSIRESVIKGGVLVYDCALAGTLNLDHSKFGGLSIHSTKLTRATQAPDLSNFPDRYAHEADALLTATFAAVSHDIYLDDVELLGGDMRLMGADVRGTLRMSRTNILGVSRLALVLQGARIEGGVMISGTPATPARFDGDLSFLGGSFSSSVTLSATCIGSAEKAADLAFDNAQITGDVVIHKTRIFGKLGATSAAFGGDLRFQGAQLLHPGEIALHGSGASISGAMDFAAADVGAKDEEPTILDGRALVDGMRVGVVRWTALHMRADALLYATDMTIERTLEALLLVADEGAIVDLTGSSAAQLSDRLGAEKDGWGAGTAKLVLDGFRYDRIVRPTGHVENHAGTIRYWRMIWLQRRTEKSSTQAARQLARILHEQGLHDGSRLVLMDAFSDEGRLAPTWGLRLMHWLFGLLFGHGFSGGRAFRTILYLWLFGTLATMNLQSRGYLIQTGKPGVACGTSIDPLLYAADVLLPVIDLGEKSRCEVGSAKPKSEVLYRWRVSLASGEYDLLGDVATARFLFDIYRLLCWIAISLAIATWSGLFKRSGRG